MAKKKILFIISNLETGGVSKSMTSLMNIVDRDRYDVALMIISPTGAFMELLPSDLRIITNPIWTALTGRIKGTLCLIKTGHPILAIGNMVRLIVGRFNKALAGQMIAAMMPGLDEEFDTIVDFNGQQQLYYMVNKLNAKKKITFFHNDYKKWPYYYSADKKYFPKVHSVWTISDICVSSLKDVFPQIKDRIHCMENISSLKLITSLSEQHDRETDCLQKINNTIITIGHVCERKGSHWAIESASILKSRGVNFKWYFLGSVGEPDKYNDLCKKFDVEDRICFLGIKVNPYPYIKAATIVAHTSQFEGKSIALDEAKLLCKPIVVTNFSTVNDQFSDRYNASICQMTPDSIAENIAELLSDSDLRMQYIQNLTNDAHDNTSEIKKLYKVFDE